MRLAICDDMESLCEYYRNLFCEIKSVTVVGTAHNGDECKALVKKEKPDVLLLDIQMRSNDEGINVIEELLTIAPALKIVMLTVHKVDDYVFRAFALGAKDFIDKTAGDAEIVSKVFDVWEDKVKLDADMTGILTKKTQDVMNRQKSMLYMIHQITKLSQSEISVLRGVYYGKTYREIAAERFVEEGTVRTQASGILQKLQSKNMKQLVKNLKEMGLFEYIDLGIDEAK